MITGFIYNVKPDISTFGKAMANGYSLAAVAEERNHGVYRKKELKEYFCYPVLMALR